MKLSVLILILTVAVIFVLPAMGSPSPEATLRLSLPSPPGAVYTGPSGDPWLDECWLLMLPGNSWTFTLRINETSASFSSHDTHLIIALNNDGYSNLLSLTIHATSIPKTTFKNGRPEPYSLGWKWPAGDVYPAWFNDTLVNLGTIPPKGYIDVTVNVAFSDATNARIHFDVYGSRAYPPPPSVPGEIARNSLSSDATVMSTGAPPPVAYPPTACFTQSPDTPLVGQTVTFDASCSQPGYDGDNVTTITEYRWDFDDDGLLDLVTSTPIATYTYSVPGTYIVTLTVYAPGIPPNIDPSYVQIDICQHEKTVQTPPPPPVGGVWVPINMSELLAPWIGLASLITVAAASVVYAKHRKKQQN